MKDLHFISIVKQNHRRLLGVALLSGIAMMSSCRSAKKQDPAPKSANPAQTQPAVQAPPPPPPVDPMPSVSVPAGFKLGEADIDTLSVQVLPGSPPEITAIVSGMLPDGATRLHESVQRKVNRRFEVRLTTIRKEDAQSTMALAPFEKRIKIQTGNLEPGTYQVVVNGVSRPFTIHQRSQNLPKIPDSSVPTSPSGLPANDTVRTPGTVRVPPIQAIQPATPSPTQPLSPDASANPIAEPRPSGPAPVEIPAAPSLPTPSSNPPSLQPTPLAPEGTLPPASGVLPGPTGTLPGPGQ